MKKLVVLLACLVSSGYVIEYGFKAMNMDSDLAYVGGMFTILLWSGFMYLVLHKIFKGDKKNEESGLGIGAVTGGSNVVGMHDSDRSGDGGNRSGS